MSKKKYIIAITSLSLVIVALVGAVVGILAATSATVTSNLYVAYTPTQDVIGTVTASYLKKGGNKTQIGTKSWAYKSAAGTNTMDATGLTIDDTNNYIIFEFLFKNDATSGNDQSKYMKVTETGSPASSLTVAKKYSNSALTTLSDSEFNNLQDKTNSVLKNIVNGTPAYIYIMVSIKTAGVSGSWGSASQNAFSFKLEASPTQFS